MNPTLLNAGIIQCLNFYSIQDNQILSKVGADQDILIGPKGECTLIIPNGQTIQVRDIVVLGKLFIQSSNMETTSIRGTLIARDIFVPGKLDIKYTDIKGRNMEISNIQLFRKELKDIIIDWYIRTDWFKFQREPAEKMGLKSILV